MTIARDFTRFEWDGFAGCEGWDWDATKKRYTQQPLIRAIHGKLFAIADCNGLGAYWDLAGNNPQEYVLVMAIPNQHVARMLLDSIAEDATLETLKAMGFQPSNT